MKEKNNSNKIIPSLNLLAMLLLTQPRLQLAFWAASACCRLVLSFSFTSTKKSKTNRNMSLLPTASDFAFQ